MTDVPFELIERRIDERLEKKLKPITRKLRKLNENLLESQRVLAHLGIFDIANDCRRTVHTQKPQTKNLFFEQLTAKLASTLKELETSSDPILILVDFNDWCINEQEELGITFIKTPV